MGLSQTIVAKGPYRLLKRVSKGSRKSNSTILRSNCFETVRLCQDARLCSSFLLTSHIDHFSCSFPSRKADHQLSFSCVVWLSLWSRRRKKPDSSARFLPGHFLKSAFDTHTHSTFSCPSSSTFVIQLQHSAFRLPFN